MVRAGDKVKVHYRAMLDDGREFDSSYRYGDPLEISVGEDDMLPGLREALLNMKVGDVYTVSIPPEEAYGEYDESLVETVPFDSFPHADQLPVGNYITLKTPSGEHQTKVVKIEDGLIYFDHNPELAGQTLNYSIELVSVGGRK